MVSLLAEQRMTDLKRTRVKSRVNGTKKRGQPDG